MNLLKSTPRPDRTITLGAMQKSIYDGFEDFELVVSDRCLCAVDKAGDFVSIGSEGPVPSAGQVGLV